MPDPRPADDDIPARLAAVEDEPARLRPQLRAATADSGAARVMASGADRDVGEVRGELRAHTRTMNALRQDQIDMRAELKAEIAELRDETRRGFATVHEGMAGIVEILGRIEGSG
jgi:uncharacterized coiled-coil DUF342 family protein